MTEVISGKERILLAQLVDLRRRETLLQRQIEYLKAENKKLKSQTNGAMTERLNHALRELESVRKLRNPKLSNEEWKMILEMRGICS